MDQVKSTASARNSTLLLLGYCLIASPLLTFLGYAIESELILPVGYHSDQLEAVSGHLRIAALCNYLLLAESLISLFTIVRKCRCYALYKLCAWLFIMGRSVIVLLILYGELVGHRQLLLANQQLTRLKIYAILLGLFEVMIVGLQVGTISRLKRKLQFMAKQYEQEV